MAPIELIEERELRELTIVELLLEPLEPGLIARSLNEDLEFNFECDTMEDCWCVTETDPGAVPCNPIGFELEGTECCRKG